MGLGTSGPLEVAEWRKGLGGAGDRGMGELSQAPCSGCGQAVGWCRAYADLKAGIALANLITCWIMKVLRSA